ncbi:hypothetical protein Y1Q_0003635 [Alligator mississippiensis]|uniref:Uncharacterized protein n=1 Tax=Alligator mississippiensis TaxID=8496 RepID=A0A151MSG1_ALLMI|nr:hypothetical protein Y1Q_0003635 [Alligator mississippiensis]
MLSGRCGGSSRQLKPSSAQLWQPQLPDNIQSPVKLRCIRTMEQLPHECQSGWELQVKAGTLDWTSPLQTGVRGRHRRLVSKNLISRSAESNWVSQ